MFTPQALRISTYLRERYRLVSDSPAGHSLTVLQLFLERTKTGRDEQFVAAFGVLAAAAGLPVRISLGFDTEVDPDGGTVARSDDVLAWPEIEFADVGWVPFNPIPEGEDSSATTGGQAVAPISERPDDVPPTVPPPVARSTAIGRWRRRSRRMACSARNSVESRGTNTPGLDTISRPRKIA